MDTKKDVARDQPTTEQAKAIWRQRRERARRWRLADLKGYPAINLEAETDATLAAEPVPVEERGKRRKSEGEE